MILIKIKIVIYLQAIHNSEPAVCSSYNHRHMHPTR